MAEDTCTWKLDLDVTSRLSIRHAELHTDRKLNVIAGRNGSGKSQLLLIVHSYTNTFNDEGLQRRGHRNYFLAEDSSVVIRGPSRVFYVHPGRLIGSHPDEVTAGAYKFGELKQPVDIKDRYTRFRKHLSKLIYDSRFYSRKDTDEENQWVRERKAEMLDMVLESFNTLFANPTLDWSVDEEGQQVFVSATHKGMGFVRPDDDQFGEPLRIPFGTLSDGEMNTLFLLFEIVFTALSGTSPVLFLIDEIENHLHPALQEHFIQLIQDLLPGNAMVLATTHSPVVLASAPPKSRLLMVHSSETDDKGNLRDNQLISVSDCAAAARAFYDLYGAQSKQVSALLLADLTTVASQELLRLVEEGFRAPAAMEERVSHDPQVRSFWGFLSGRAGERDRIKLLDVGSGWGGMISGLLEPNFESDILYVFDLVEPVDARRRRLEELKGRSTPSVQIGEVVSSISEISNARHYDGILLHNAVHELPTCDLVQLLHRAGLLLGKGGAIHVLELEILQEGEYGACVIELGAFQALLERLGYSTVAGYCESYGGIPMYEITATLRLEGEQSEADVAESLCGAYGATAVHSLGCYTEPETDPMERAFHALNYVHARVRVEELQRAS